ncbi:MAG: tRNA (adenosine(37)-N6)-dimethylallyltransferase MiaA [Xanthomonadales bacterium]|nr:tRNA (adenosine(37)-N6)-dimethylallyltransferase MiaA [Xanthomonadales bacterium]
MSQATLPPVIFLMGPTAAGKTGLAVRLVEAFPLEIISVDSALVYRGMDIGTAKPDAATLVRAPHRLIDIREPTERYSAAEFRDDALAAIEDILAKGRYPLLAGGTMLYFRALQRGLSELPSASPEIRMAIEEEAARLGWAKMHRQLASLDPVAADRINPNDPQRIQRALEVIRISGRPLSELQTGGDRRGFPYRVLKLIVCPPDRAVLHQRIERRFRSMLEEGFVEEVRRLRALDDFDANLPAMRSVGYRQALAWLEGELAADEWQEKAIASTRQLAKRQLTWLRKEEGALWYDPAENGVEKDVFEKVEDFLKSAS